MTASQGPHRAGLRNTTSEKDGTAHEVVHEAAYRTVCEVSPFQNRGKLVMTAGVRAGTFSVV